MAKFEKGHKAVPGCGRPKGAKTDTPFRNALQDRYTIELPKLMDRLFTELYALEGFAFVSAWEKIAKKLMPDLQSIQLDAVVENGKSPLLQKIEQLQEEEKKSK